MTKVRVSLDAPRPLPLQNSPTDVVSKFWTGCRSTGSPEPARRHPSASTTRWKRAETRISSVRRRFRWAFRTSLLSWSGCPSCKHRAVAMTSRDVLTDAYPLCSWTRLTGNVVFASEWPSGGHFAAHEKPEELATDLRKMFGKGGKAYGVVSGKDGY